ncbi:MAG: hypothetical protein Kow0098_18700 [Ignavibacteriaceae bacterium]
MKINLNVRVYSHLKPGLYHGSAALLDRITFFILFSITSQFFGADFLGRLSSALGIANLLMVVSDFGLPVLIQRESSKETDLSSLVTSSTILKLINSLVFFIFIPVYTSFNNDLIFAEFTAAYLSILFFSFSNLFLAVYLGQQLNRKYFMINASGHSAVIGIVLLVILVPEEWIVYTALITGGVIQFLVVFMSKERPGLEIINLKALKNIFIKALPIGAGLIFVFAYNKSDILIISALRNTEETGNYYSAYLLIRSFTVITSFYLVNYFTLLSGSFVNNNELFKRYVKESFTISIGLGIIFSIIFYFAGGWLLKIFLGNTSAEAVNIIRMLSVSVVFMIMNYNLGVVLNSMNREKVPMTGAAVAFGLNLTGNLLFVPDFGAQASAVMVVLTETVMFTILLFSFIIFQKN